MIIFDASKGETHHAKANFHLLARRLRCCGKIKHNKREVTNEVLSECELFVIANPQAPFSEKELQVLLSYIDGGGALAVFATEGGESSNLNELLTDFGIRIDDSSVVRSVYHKYAHPKHALIQNGVVQPEIGLEKDTSLAADPSTVERATDRPQIDSEPSMSLSFLYPNGTTLVVQSPSLTLLSSGSTSFPVDCPVAAAWEGEKVSDNASGKSKQGRMIVVGSADIFSDDWIEKEENVHLSDVLFRFLLHRNVSFDPSIGRSDFEERETVPDISSLANLVKSCIQEEDPLPQDYKSLLIDKQFGLKMDHITFVIEMYKRLNVPYEPLTLVEPHFECPQPSLRMATHPPQMIAPPPPALELFDLDESFLDIRTRLQ